MKPNLTNQMNLEDNPLQPYGEARIGYDEAPTGAAVAPDKTTVPTINTAFWMTLIGIGFVMEFIGRLIGLQDNPTGFWLELAPLLTTTAAATVVIYGVFMIMRTWSKKDLGGFRLGMMVVFFGGVLLFSSEAGKSIVQTLFGG
ncbi:MAG: hypothetical protein LBU61_05375 [Coriobacteriales bacterium]|jgi:hypothetical protein|nr:hypothetical protein [Coriobacteriales bacterium]